jgi:hypothetical protein
MEKTRNEYALEYGTATMARAFTPSLEDYWRITPMLGMIWDSGWPYARVTDKNGQSYFLCREYQKTCTNFNYVSKLQKGLESVSPSLFTRPYIGAITFEQPEPGGVIQVKSNDMPGMQSKFQFEIEANHFHWLDVDGEGGKIDLQFDALGPALQFVTLGGKIRQDMYYTSEICKVSGTILGEEVSGFGGLDQAWMPPGMSYLQGKTYHYLETYWIYFANRYADGSVDYGVLIHGAGNWNMSFYVDKGKSYISTENEFQRTWGDGGYPAEVNTKTPTHHLRFTCDSRTAPMPEFHVQWTTGKVINLAKKELPVESVSNIEYRVREQCDD